MDLPTRVRRVWLILLCLPRAHPVEALTCSKLGLVSAHISANLRSEPTFARVPLRNRIANGVGIFSSSTTPAQSSHEITDSSYVPQDLRSGRRQCDALRAILGAGC